MTTKICIICKEEKDIEGFWYHNKAKNTRLPRCIPCAKTQPSYIKNLDKARIPDDQKRRGRYNPVDENDEKMCFRCDTRMHVDKFPKKSNQCKKCLYKYVAHRRRTMVREPTDDPLECKVCLKEKEAVNFKPNRESKFGRRRVCFECVEEIKIQKKIARLQAKAKKLKKTSSD